MKTAPARRIRRSRGRSRILGTYSFLIYLFLYVPIALVALFSFTAGRYAGQLSGFSLKWYATAWTDGLVTQALRNSLVIGLTSATFAAVFGTAAALALRGVRSTFVRSLYDSFTYAAIIVPGLVIGISTLVFFVAAFPLANHLLTSVWPFPSTPPKLALGRPTVIAAHTTFTMALVILVVRARAAGMDRSLVEASNDLFASPARTFLQVTLPQLAPAIVVGFLLSFTLSFDDFIVAFFVAGPSTTLPMYVFASIRRGVTPEINAIAASMLCVTLLLIFIAQMILRKATRSTETAAVSAPVRAFPEMGQESPVPEKATSA